MDDAFLFIYINTFVSIVVALIASRFVPQRRWVLLSLLLAAVPFVILLIAYLLLGPRNNFIAYSYFHYSIGFLLHPAGLVFSALAMVKTKRNLWVSVLGFVCNLAAVQSITPSLF